MPGKLGRDVRHLGCLLRSPAQDRRASPSRVSRSTSRPTKTTAGRPSTRVLQNAVTITVSGVDKAGVLRADMYAGTRTKAMTCYPDGGEV